VAGQVLGLLETVGVEALAQRGRDHPALGALQWRREAARSERRNATLKASLSISPRSNRSRSGNAADRLLGE
jgi:hypothetical protein